MSMGLTNEIIEENDASKNCQNKKRESRRKRRTIKKLTYQEEAEVFADMCPAEDTWQDPI